MRCAIIADIHANLQALAAVLEDARACECEDFQILGDIVGYNANPAECVDLVKGLSGTCVLGNHDAAVAGLEPLHHFSSLARESLEWTAEQLDADQRKWLASLRPMRQIRRHTIVHATLDSPTSWAYIRSPETAEMSLACQRTPVAFFGHTHVPGIFVQGGEPIPLFGSGEGLLLPKAGKLFINAGSVGQPRDGDPRACYLVYDEESGGLWMRRVEYDVESAGRAIRDAGLPGRLADRLLSGS